MDILAPINAGSTSVLVQFFVQNNALPGVQGLVGLTAATANLSASYRLRGSGAGGVTIVLAAATLGTWQSGGFAEIDSSKMPGWYELGVPNAALSNAITPGDVVDLMLLGALNMATVELKIPLNGGGGGSFNPGILRASLNFAGQPT